MGTVRPAFNTSATTTPCKASRPAGVLRWPPGLPWRASTAGTTRGGPLLLDTREPQSFVEWVVSVQICSWVHPLLYLSDCGDFRHGCLEVFEGRGGLLAVPQPGFCSNLRQTDRAVDGTLEVGFAHARRRVGRQLCGARIVAERVAYVGGECRDSWPHSRVAPRQALRKRLCFLRSTEPQQ